MNEKQNYFFRELPVILWNTHKNRTCSKKVKKQSVRKLLESEQGMGENRTFCIVKPPKSGDFGGNSGCGGRTRTYDLRVMS